MFHVGSPLPGVYGDVVRVKIMFNKKDNALVQFTDPSQAQLGTLSVVFIAVCHQYVHHQYVDILLESST